MNCYEESISVTELIRTLNTELESIFPTVIVRGEIGEFSRASSGHFYFSLKDDSSQISAVMWRTYASSVKTLIKAGDSVVCHGDLQVYSKSGRLQLIVKKIIPLGEGLLQRRFLELKAKLEKEGLFSDARKRPIPPFPRAVGIVTSPGGAVIHDMLVKLKERMPSVLVYLYGVRVQGAEAPEEIVEAIRFLGQSGLVDVIIIARGGGSLEELQAFNDEAVVRAVFGSTIPVISGVGHEVDVTLCDLAADLRAPTPTAAAEMVVQKQDDLLNIINRFCKSLLDHSTRCLQLKFQELDEIDEQFFDILIHSIGLKRQILEMALARLSSFEPSHLLKFQRERIQILLDKAFGLLRDRMLLLSNRTLSGYRTLEKLVSSDRFLLLKANQDNVYDRLDQALRNVVDRGRYRVEILEKKLVLLSPNKVLERGFALVSRDGVIIKSGSCIEIGSLVEINFHDDGVSARAEKHWKRKP